MACVKGGVEEETKSEEVGDDEGMADKKMR